jgi:uncharacterized protein (TIGR02246 family)
MISTLFVAFFALSPPMPRPAVLTAIEAQRDAWNRGDLDAFCVVYADDATFLSPNGVTKGRAEVLARYKKRYPDKKAMGTLSFEYVDLRSDKTHASVAAKWKLTYDDKPEASGHTLIVWEKRGDKWTLTQDASM